MEAIQPHNLQYVFYSPVLWAEHRFKVPKCLFKRAVNPILHQQQHSYNCFVGVLEQYPPQLLSSTEADSRELRGTNALLQDGVKVKIKPEANQQILASPGPMGFTLPCSQLRGESQVPRVAPHLQQAQPQLRGSSTYAVPCHPRVQTGVTGSALFRTPGWQLPTHLVSHPSNTAWAQSRAAHSNSICAFEPKPVITATDSSSSPGGLWSYPDFSGALFLPGTLILQALVTLKQVLVKNTARQYLELLNSKART